MGRKEGVEAELLGASARLGVAGGHGYGDDDGELRSVVCAGGKQRRERGPGEERGGAGGEGGSVASRGRLGNASVEAGGGRGSVGARHRAASCAGMGRKIGMPLVGWAASWAGQVGWLVGDR